MKLTIPGRCVPAVRMTQKSKFVNPQAQKYLAYKEEVAYRAKRVFAEPLTGNLTANLVVYFSDNRRRDLDNIYKSVTDALNNIAYLDDSQITKATIEKVKGEPERVEIEIRSLVGAGG